MDKMKILSKPILLWIVILVVNFIYNLVLFFDIISKPYLSALEFLGFANNGVITNIIIIALICLTAGIIVAATTYLLQKYISKKEK